MSVELREAEILDRGSAQGAERIFDGLSAVLHVREQGFYLFGAHSPSVGCAAVPDLSSDQQTLALAIVAGVALLSFFTSIFLALRLRKVRSQYASSARSRGAA